MLLLAFDADGAGRESLFEGIFVCLEHGELHLGSLVGSGFRRFLGFGEAGVDCLEVLDLEFVVYDFHVADGVDGAVNVSYVVVVEAAEHV